LVKLTPDWQQGDGFDYGHRFDVLWLHFHALHLWNRLRVKHHRMSDVTVIDTRLRDVTCIWRSDVHVRLLQPVCPDNNSNPQIYFFGEKLWNIWHPESWTRWCCNLEDSNHLNCNNSDSTIDWFVVFSINPWILLLTLQPTKHFAGSNFESRSFLLRIVSSTGCCCCGQCNTQNLFNFAGEKISSPYKFRWKVFNHFWKCCFIFNCNSVTSLVSLHGQEMSAACLLSNYNFPNMWYISFRDNHEECPNDKIIQEWNIKFVSCVGQPTFAYI